MARPSNADLALMTNDELASLSKDITEEQHRRDDLERLPVMIESITQRFIDQGGDKEKIRPPQSYTKGNSKVRTTPEGVPNSSPRKTAGN